MGVFFCRFQPKKTCTSESLKPPLLQVHTTTKRGRKSSQFGMYQVHKMTLGQYPTSQTCLPASCSSLSFSPRPSKTALMCLLVCLEEKGALLTQRNTRKKKEKREPQMHKSKTQREEQARHPRPAGAGEKLTEVWKRKSEIQERNVTTRGQR